MIMEGIWRKLHIPFFMVIARLGKVDQNGKLVVKYKYDVYCNNKGIEDTNMYYCKSRFYVSKWRRWLNSDSIDYLEPQNITCLNLFAYCNNNPVMYVDPTGDFAFLY